jgi:HAD superfamily hydrolase (TIGR01509 family)
MPDPVPVRLVIFDCDGVLVDSDRLAVRVEAAMLAEHGWPLTEAEITQRFGGMTEQAMAMAIETHLGRPLPDGWFVEYARRTRAVFATDLRPVAGVLEALDAIDVPTCVASSGSHDKMCFTLGRTGLYERFAGRIFSAEEVAHGKPAPDLFLHAAEQMGTAPAACAVIEDSAHGVAAARAAGMRAFAYSGGLTAADRLAGPITVVFDDMRDLPRLLAESSHTASLATWGSLTDS